MEIQWTPDGRQGRTDTGDLTAVCDRKPWLGNYQEYPASSYPYTFEKIEDMETFMERMGHGNWSIRTGFLFGGLSFVLQVNGGDEWLALYQRTPGRWTPLDSFSFAHILQRGGADEFRALMRDLVKCYGDPDLVGSTAGGG
jgi:hypothetical protein